MARRQSYTRVVRSNFQNPDHVKGMGDRVFRGFQCLNKDCTNFIFVREDGLGGFLHQLRFVRLRTYRR